MAKQLKDVQLFEIEPKEEGGPMYRVLYYLDSTREDGAPDLPFTEVYECTPTYEYIGDCDTGPQVSVSYVDWQLIGCGMGCREATPEDEVRHALFYQEQEKEWEREQGTFKAAGEPWHGLGLTDLRGPHEEVLRNNPPSYKIEQ